MGVWNLFCVLVLLGSLGFGNSQRKQGRNIAVVSEGKIPANFDCPEEFGYYPHPTDCTQYYVCVFGGALLESCTGGLMYSHELQTCDWPRNVGCDGLDTVPVSSPGGDVRVSVLSASRTPVREREERVRYTVVPTVQPQPVISSRGQSRQLHATVHERVHSPQDIISKQQQQLYAEAADVHQPAEEIENDRQQRVYRGQPSTVGQVQRDRDGLRHTNAIPSNNRAEKIGVISFGTQQQQQPDQQYRNNTFYTDNSLTKDLTAMRRRKRQIRRRLAPLDLIATADSSISWTRHVPVPHVLYQRQQVQQQPKQTYHNNRLNSMELQPPPHLNFKPQQQEYSAILSGDQTDFQPFSPKSVAYKTPTQSIATIQTLKPNSYIVPKVVKQAGLYQYFKSDPRSQFPQDQIDNYSYFNLGVTTSPNVVYAPSNQAKIMQTYYQPNLQSQQYENQFKPITNSPSHNIEYINNQKPVPQYQEPPKNDDDDDDDDDDEQKKQSAPANQKPEELENEDEKEDEDEDEEPNQKNNEQSPEIKPEFPSPPPFFFKSTNKYENIENPFADPNFDFDKFISKIKGHDESNSNNKQTSNSKPKEVVYSKGILNVELRTPVAFSAPQKKKNATKPPPDEYYYYDDEDETIYEKQKKASVKQEYETPMKSATAKTYSPINKNQPSGHQVNAQNNKKTSNLHLSLVTLRTEVKKPKTSKDDIFYQKGKLEDDDYEYYDDYDYDSAEKNDEKYEQPQIKKPTSNFTTPKPLNSKSSSPKNTNPSTTIFYQNKSQSFAPQGAKYIEKSKENKPASSQTIEHKHITSSTPRTTQTTYKMTTIKFPIRQATIRPLTSTIRPQDKDATTQKNYVKSSSRLEESNVNTKSHSIGAPQSIPSGRLYNGSQHYDPSQYDPYYTLYEDDVELYRDVDYSQQQQYSNNRAHPQQVYRGTPAPVSVPIQSTIQEETIPQRNSAYYSTQAQDVYSQNYHDDNYDTEVDDQSNYRPSSRQPTRGDRNELSYFVESTQKSTTTSRTTTTTTTTTPRPIPVQKQSMVPSRSPIIAANQTRPQSITIPLSASLGQKYPTTQSLNTTTTTTTTNETVSLTPKPPSRFISLSTGFNLRQTSDNAEPSPFTYKPYFTQKISTADSNASGAIRRLPFSLTKLPDNETKSIVFRLSSRLSASSQNVSKTESQPSFFQLQSTENPNKREVVNDKEKLTVAHEKNTASTPVIPTTYSPYKAILASILPKHDNESIKSTNVNNSNEEKIVSILPNKNVMVNSTTESTTAGYRKSVIIENNSRTQFENDDKPVKSIIQKLLGKVESTTPTSFTETSKGERKIISKIHFGIPQTNTNSKKVFNLASTPSSFRSSTFDPEDSEESRNEKSNRYFTENRRPMSAYYITTDLTTSQRPKRRFSVPEIKHFDSTPSTSEESSSFENINTSKENVSSQRFRTRFSIPYKQTTERGNSVRYTPNVFESEYFDSIEQNSNTRSNYKFSFPVNMKPTTERQSYVKESPNNENSNNKEIHSYTERLQPTTNSNLNYFASSTSKRSNTEEEKSSTERQQSKLSFNSNLTPTEQRNNYVKNASSTETPTSTGKILSNTNSENFLSNSNLNFNTARQNYLKNTPSTSPSNEDYIYSGDVPSTDGPQSKFSFKSTTERENYFKFFSSSSQLTSTIKNEYASTSARPYNKFSLNLNPVSTNENGNIVTYTTSTTEKSSGADTNFVARNPIFRFIYKPAPSIGNESVEKVESSSTALKHVLSTTTEISTSRPLYQYNGTTSTERPNIIKYVPSPILSSTATLLSSTTTTNTASTSTEHSIDKNKNKIISDRATEKNPFIENSSEIADKNYKVRSELFVNRNVKPLRATAELPTLSEILTTQDEPRKKEVDSPPTYKPKPFSLTDANKNRTSVDISRNVTLPVRLSRVNTAIKSLTAFGGTRRNSQTPKCNENETTPDTKCNEIQKHRFSTRGRGSAHYTSSSAGENLQSINVNRGTPATPRSRPTLKPSTSIVSKAQEYVDIYRYPPQRPEPLYPQPQVDKTAAKCRKDVCLLPDCSCGGKDIPGDLPVEQVPQIVLLTFDDSVNDLNKGLYSDLFEKGRTNPNGCPIAATFYVSHEWTDYSQVQNLYADGHELASHTVSHSFGEQFSQKKWNREVAGQREILAAYGGVHLEDVKGMRAPFLSVGGNKMFKMLYDSNFTYDSSLPVYENKPPSWPYTLDYKLFHDCMIPPCPTRSYPGVWEVPMVMWQDLNGGRCSMGDACSNPADAEGVTKMLMKNFERHYTTNRAPFGLFYHAAWFTQPHHKEGFIKFLDFLVSKDDVYLITNWQALQWVREPTPLSRVKNFHGFQCNYADRPKRCNNPKVCNLWHKSGVRYMKTCQPCPDIYPWTGKSGIRSSRIDNDIED